ncbi:hypothetical protein OGW13_00515, partial [Citrobacter sp. Ca225]|uniref:hypothetical protein n=1 Tax=Citrobacter sp. Ca225 TaxID=2985002 RepID=UPI002580653A
MFMVISFTFYPSVCIEHSEEMCALIYFKIITIPPWCNSLSPKQVDLLFIGAGTECVYLIVIASPFIIITLRLSSCFFVGYVRSPQSLREGANKQVISSQADSLIKISRIWAD